MNETDKQDRKIMLSGSKHLRYASILEIVIGILIIVFVRMLLGADVDYTAVLNETTASNAMLALVAAYGAHFFEILVGIIGLIKANKKSILTVILGVLLFVVNLWNFFTFDTDVMQIIFLFSTLLAPYYYLHNAWKNYKG